MKKRSNKGDIFLFDSCAGGFGVMNHFMKWAGDYNITFVADYEKIPFGVQSKEDISKIVISWFKNYISTLENNSIKLIVIACNTASIASTEIMYSLIDQYDIPIVTMIDGFRSGIENNIKKVNGKNIGIFGTKYTIESGVYSKILKSYDPKEVYNIIGTNSEASVAKGFYQDSQGKKDIAGELLPFKDANIDTIILGCTRFEIIQSQIQNIFKRDIEFINPGFFVSEKAREVLGVVDDIETNLSTVTILSTQLNEKSEKGLNESSNNYFGCKLNLSEIKIFR